MVAIQTKIWDRLGPGEDLLFKDLTPVLSDVFQYKKNLNHIVASVYEKSLHLFSDIEEVILPAGSGEESSRARSRDPLAFYLQEVKGLGTSNREEENLLARALEIARLVLRKELLALPYFPKRLTKSSGLGTTEPRMQEIFHKIQHGKTKLPPGPRGYTAKLQRTRQRLDEMNRIRALLIARNLHLVPKFARKYRHLGVPYQDLIQEGNASLLRAADKFDWRRGVRFSTYAQWWINQAMLKGLYCQSRVVRVPVYLNQKMKKIRDANSESWSETGQDLSAEEISKNLSEPVGRIRRALRANVGTYSLDQVLDPNEEHALKDLIVDRSPAPASDLPEGPALKERVADLLTTLPEKERQILVLRFGLDGKEPQTLDQVSKLFGVSRERIRQLQVQALRKLLQPSKKQKLASFLN